MKQHWAFFLRRRGRRFEVKRTANRAAKRRSTKKSNMPKIPRMLSRKDRGFYLPFSKIFKSSKAEAYRYSPIKSIFKALINHFKYCISVLDAKLSDLDLEPH